MKKIALAICLAAVSAFGESYWGSYTNGVVSRAPNSINGVVNPTGAMYLEAGYKRIIDTPPAYSNGYTAVRTAWTNEGVVVTAVYEYVQNPPPVHTYSRLKLYAALSSMGLWEPLVEWMKTQTVEGVNVWTAFNLANELADDHPLFAGYLRQAQTALGLTDAQVAAILEGCRND